MTIRRLAAILAADLVGFSSLMEADEEGTLQQIKALQSKTMLPQVQEHGGRLAKTTGDGFLVEFPSTVEAVRCALAIQNELAVGPLKMRIGINLGDIMIEDDGDVYGEGVNIAARLEALCEPGRILISGKVFDEIEGKVEGVFESTGTQHVKNISRPVRTYALKAVPGGRRLARPAVLEQQVHYCRAPDGVRLAWATVGGGPPLVKAATI